MKPTLNQADIELLNETFVTKDDLVAFEKELGLESAT